MAEQIRGVTFSKGDSIGAPADGYLPVLTASNITENGLTMTPLQYIPASKISPKQRLRTNDVVVTASSGSLDVVGRAVAVHHDLDAGFGAFCKVLRPDSSVDPRYFFHYFRTPKYRAEVSRLAAGANINNLRNEDLDNLSIPLPPLPEQRRIAAILDGIDLLRSARLDSIRASRLAQSAVFAANRALESADQFEIGELFRVSGGKRLPKGADYFNGQTNHPYLRVTDMKEGVFDHRNLRYIADEVHASIAKYTVDSGDIAISIAGTIGLIAKVPSSLAGANLTENAARLHPIAPVNTTFMAHQLRSAVLQDQIRSSTAQVTIGKLALFRIEKLRVRMPPIEVQARLAAQIEAIAGLESIQVKHLAGLDALISSVRSDFFG